MPTKEQMAQSISQLATLAPLEYDQVRAQEAKRLSVRVANLDNAVTEARKKIFASGASMKALTFVDTEPWPEPVHGHKLLNQIVEMLRKYLVLPNHSP